MGVQQMINPCPCSYNEKVVRTFVNDATPVKVGQQHRPDGSPATRPLKRISKFTHDTVLNEFADIAHISAPAAVEEDLSGVRFNSELDTSWVRYDSERSERSGAAVAVLDVDSALSTAPASRGQCSVLNMDMDGPKKMPKTARFSVQNGNRRVSCTTKHSEEDIVSLLSQVLGNTDPDTTIMGGKPLRASACEMEVLEDGTLLRLTIEDAMKSQWSMPESTKFVTPWERGQVVPAGHFVVTLDRDEDDDEVGLDVDWGDMVKLKIVAIKEGLMATYNAAAGANGGRVVNAGDFIVNINGVQGSSCKLMKLIRDSPSLKLLIRNGSSMGSMGAQKSWLDA